MLLQLSIHHLALIDDMTIDFEPGMNVMTGETGAGKSIVVDAVNLVLGERADRDLITSGEMKARVEAVFDIADNEKVKSVLSELTLTGDEDTASISRELTSAGRNICRINGTIVPLQTLRQVSAQLLDIHGQHEHQLLLDSKNHIGYLDEYAADEIHPMLAEGITAMHVGDHFKFYINLGAEVPQNFKPYDFIVFDIKLVEPAAAEKAEPEK